MRRGDCLQDLCGDWRRRAKTLRRYGGETPATALEVCAKELEAALRPEDDTFLTLTEAARESGYSVDHLGRLVREVSIARIVQSVIERGVG